MSLKKVAFNASEHEKICRRIMKEKFNREQFYEVQKWIDGDGGWEHRYKHGHDQIAEAECRKRWGENGVLLFQLHVIADRVQDDLGEIVSQRLKEIQSNVRPFPYFEKDYTGEDPHCLREKSYFQSQGAADPNAKVTGIINTRKCKNCGSTKDLTLAGWEHDLVTCNNCILQRGLGFCSKCGAYFASSTGKKNPHGSTISSNMCSICG